MHDNIRSGSRVGGGGGGFGSPTNILKREKRCVRACVQMHAF